MGPKRAKHEFNDFDVPDNKNGEPVGIKLPCDPDGAVQKPGPVITEAEKKACEKSD